MFCNLDLGVGLFGDELRARAGGVLGEEGDAVRERERCDYKVSDMGGGTMSKKIGRWD
jgi:hypothetical protein